MRWNFLCFLALRCLKWCLKVQTPSWFKRECFKAPWLVVWGFCSGLGWHLMSRSAQVFATHPATKGVLWHSWDGLAASVSRKDTPTPQNCALLHLNFVHCSLFIWPTSFTPLALNLRCFRKLQQWTTGCQLQVSSYLPRGVSSLLQGVGPCFSLTMRW